MKRKHLSILVIVTTIIAVSIMLYSIRDTGEKEYIMVQEEEHEELIKEPLEEEEKKEDEALKNDMGTKVKEKQKVEEKTGQDLDNSNIEKSKDLQEENMKESYEETESDNEELFKVDKNSILNSLSKEEKKEVRKLIKKLSINDYISIVSSIKNDGELECCSKIVTILNKRLNEEDYNRAREIFNPYVNIEYLEEIVLNR